MEIYNDLKGAMSPEYYCLRSILWLSRYLMPLHIDKMFLQSSLFTKTISSKFHQGAQTIITSRVTFAGIAPNFFKFQSRSILAIRSKRQQETVIISMPIVLSNKTGSLFLEFNSCEDMF